MLRGVATASATVTPVSASTTRTVPPLSTIYASGGAPCFTGNFGAGGGRKEPSARSTTSAGAVAEVVCGDCLDPLECALHPISATIAMIGNAGSFIRYLTHF